MNLYDLRYVEQIVYKSINNAYYQQSFIFKPNFH